ncbi:MAG: thioesterase family protein [Flavobacteriales bacterium]|nr:thioesterase family protein [Bacteroidota bacterium]MCB9241107.1 thioesterase family protein [Flavobacteriales bacterium]
MSRIEIDKPEKVLFTTEYLITVSDLNYGNHLGNERVLIMAQECRLRWLRSMGYSEIDFFGSSLIQVDAGIIYRSEGFHGNSITISLGILNPSSRSFDLVYTLFNTSTDKVLAEVKTRMVCFNYEIRRPEMLPEKFRETCLEE